MKSTAKTYLLPILATALLVAGCATTIPQLPITDPDERIQFNGFSLLPPKGTGWKWIGRKGQDKSAFFNTTFSKADGDRTYFAMAALLDTEGKESSPDELLSEVKNYEMFKEGPRQTNIKSTFKIVHTLGHPCVRYDFTAEDHNVPYNPNTIYKLDGHGFFCTHPKANGVVTIITYSRRSPKNASYVGAAEEGERFLESVQFTEVKR